MNIYQIVFNYDVINPLMTPAQGRDPLPQDLCFYANSVKKVKEESTHVQNKLCFIALLCSIDVFCCIVFFAFKNV